MNNFTVFKLLVFYLFYFKKVANELYKDFCDRIEKGGIKTKDWTTYILKINLLGAIVYIIFLNRPFYGT